MMNKLLVFTAVTLMMTSCIKNLALNYLALQKNIMIKNMALSH